MNQDQSPANGQPLGERRKHPRHYTDLPVDCCLIENKKKGPVHVGIAENAGIGGLSICLNQRFPCGHHLIIELYYRDSYQFSSLKILTRVIWNSDEREGSGFRHGLQVLRLQNGGSLKLRSLLKHCPVLS